MNDWPLDFAIEGHKPTAIVALATGVVERVGAVRRLKQAGTRARGVPEKELRVHRRAAAAGSQGRAAPADTVIEACKNVEAQTSRSTRRPWCTESGDSKPFVVGIRIAGNAYGALHFTFLARSHRPYHTTSI